MAAEIQKSFNFFQVLEEYSFVPRGSNFAQNRFISYGLPDIKYIFVGLSVTLSLMVFKINNIFHFPQNSRWPPKFEKV